MSCPLFHPLPPDDLASSAPLPTLFTYPFAYVPSDVCRAAARAVRSHLLTHPEWAAELEGGKMMGVLVCRDPEGNVGFLAAFSGTLGGTLTHPWFVPPVLDYEQPTGIFKTEENAISTLNRHIDALRQSDELRNLRTQLSQVQTQSHTEIETAKALMAQHKDQRRILRAQHPEMADELDRQSQFEKAELKRLTARWRTMEDDIKSQIATHEAEVQTLVTERKRRSNILQRWLFSRMRLSCADGAQVSVRDIFLQAGRGIPPSGTGECAAPRILHYAYGHGLCPISMAEFWVGRSPVGQIRTDGDFYPACQTKCGPLLSRMLRGVPMEPNPLVSHTRPVLMGDTERPLTPQDIVILYEDADLMAVEKPEGLVTVTDRTDVPSLMQMVRQLRPDIEGPGYVHRLDQATSGIVLIAKRPDVHTALQMLFETRRVRKRYVAILERTPRQTHGVINLPLIPNIDDRPRQMVDMVRGRRALTRFEVVESYANGRTRVFFYPETGRTHQLRVHAASPLGLGAPIVGDNLYGHLSERLMLHADMLEFEHPTTGRVCRVVSHVPF